MKKILIIDDDEQVRLMLKKTLERAGYEVFEAPEGQSGMRINRQTPVDLIITDIFMPGQEGMATIIEITESFPDIKIIAISGGGGRMANPMTFLDMAKQLGANRIFQKPVDRVELLQEIGQILIEK